MAEYFVRKTGNDGSAGTSAATAWLTVDKAANTVVAGDHVAIGAGVYPELVTMDTSGSNGSSIIFEADIDGSLTGDPGMVIITAHDSQDAAATRTGCLDMNGKEFIEWRKVLFMGGSAGTFVVGNTAQAGHIAYEGVVFADSMFVPTSTGSCLKLELNNGATPTANGLQLLRNFFHGDVEINWDTQATAHLNIKWLVDGNIFFPPPYQSASGNAGMKFSRVTDGGNFAVGGVTITNNTFLAGKDSAGLEFGLELTNTTNPFLVFNNTFWGFLTALNAPATPVGALIAGNNRFISCGTALSGAAIISYPGNILASTGLMGGLHDLILHKVFGWSPFKPFEPMTYSGYTDPGIDVAANQYSQTTDFYSNLREMGRATALGNIFLLDGSDAAVTDPNAAWLNEANVFDYVLTTAGSCGTAGSNASNFILAEGTNAPAAGGTIVKVQTRIRYAGSSASARTVGWEVFTDALGESLGSFTQAMSATTQLWSAFSDLTVPSGGWTWAKVQALEVKVWEVSGGANIQIYQVGIGVITDEATPDTGAVEARIRPAKESGTVDGGVYSANFLGTGYYETFVPVSAASTTITARGRFDGNYATAVNKPKLEVFNIPGVANQSDTMTSASGVWETLSVNFTPTAAGIVRVRISGFDVSTAAVNGKAFFDNIAVS